MNNTVRIAQYIGGFGMAIFALCAPMGAYAQETVAGYEDTIFKARVVEILEQRTIVDEYTGVASIQQDVRVVGLAGEWEGVEYEIFGIVDYVVAEAKQYNVGQTVYVNHSIRPNQEDRFFIMDYVRTGSLWWMAGLFVAVVLLVARWKGFRALLVLLATFVIIIKFMVPQIIAGVNPLLVSVLGAMVILFLAIFATEGFNKKSAIVFSALTLSLGMVIGFSEWFTYMAHLSGLATEEAMYLLSTGEYVFDLRGLLLAGMVIGALGVLDDTVVSQVSVVKEITAAQPSMKSGAVFTTAMRVGTDHINAIINTLFLAYAGVSLPLLVLFVLYDNPTFTLEFVINGELIATEIVRTLAGSIALVLSVPIATALAVWAFTKKRNKRTIPPNAPPEETGTPDAFERFFHHH